MRTTNTSAVFVAVLLSTGPILLHQRELSIFDSGAWPAILQIKLGLVGLLLVLTFAHDLILGPRVRKISAISEGARSFWEQALFRTTTWLPRVTLLLALGVIFAAVLLVRS